MKNIKESEIAKFWTNNPMIFQGKEYGYKLNLNNPDEIFKNMERIHRRKNSLHQKEDEPLLSKFIDYKNLKGKTVLDIGFGIGWLTNELQKKAKKVYGIELSKTSLKLSNYRFRNCKNVSLKIASAEKIPFKDNFFDFITSYGVLHHAENDDNCFNEIHRVLKPGRKCFLMLYRKGGPKYWWSKLFRQGILKGGLYKHNFNIEKFIHSVTDTHGLVTKGAPLSRHYTRKQLKKKFSNSKKSRFIITGNADEWKKKPFERLPLTNLLGNKILHWLVGISGAYWFIKLQK